MGKIFGEYAFQTYQLNSKYNALLTEPVSDMRAENVSASDIRLMRASQERVKQSS